MAPWATVRDFYLDPSFIIKMKLNTEDAILTTNRPLRQWCSLRADDRSARISFALRFSTTHKETHLYFFRRNEFFFLLSTSIR